MIRRYVAVARVYYGSQWVCILKACILAECLYRFIQLFRHLFLHRFRALARHLSVHRSMALGEEEECSLPPSPPSCLLSLNIVQKIPTLQQQTRHNIPTSVQVCCVCQPASQPICKKKSPIVQNPSSFHLPSHSAQCVLLHGRARALLHVRQVLPAGGVPRRHVLLHAVGVAGRFAGRERGARGRDAAVEAVFVEFLGGIESGRGRGN
jgi:hypothetical protein